MGGFSNGPFGSMPFGLESTETEIVNWNPTIFDEISRLGVIEFDVLNAAWGDTFTTVRAIYRTGVVETIFEESTGFTELFRRGSTRKQIADGNHYVLRRTGGWLGGYVRIDVKALDEPPVIPPTPVPGFPLGFAVLTDGVRAFTADGALIIYQFQAAPAEPTIPDGFAVLTYNGSWLTLNGVPLVYQLP